MEPAFKSPSKTARLSKASQWTVKFEEPARDAESEEEEEEDDEEEEEEDEERGNVRSSAFSNFSVKSAGATSSRKSNENPQDASSASSTQAPQIATRQDEVPGTPNFPKVQNDAAEDSQQRRADSAFREARKRNAKAILHQAPGPDASRYDHFIFGLRRKHGSVLRAWRRDIDKRGAGKVAYTDFTTACKVIGAAQQVKQLWTLVKRQDDGPLDFAELEPYEAANLESFAELLWQYVGFDKDKAWKLFDVDHKERISFDDFILRCDELGFTGDAELVFFGLDLEALGWVWRKDFEYLSKVSRLAQSKLLPTREWLQELTSWAQAELGGAEELIGKLGLGGGCREVSVTDLAARLAALGFHGDAQQAAVRAARYEGGTQVSADSLFALLSGMRPPAISSSIKKLPFRRERPATVTTPAPGQGFVARKSHRKGWRNSVSEIIAHNEEKSMHGRKYFSYIPPLNRPFNPEPRKLNSSSSAPSLSFTKDSVQKPKRHFLQPEWDTSPSPAVRNAFMPATTRQYFHITERPVRDEVRLELAQRAAIAAAIRAGEAWDG